MIKLYGIPASRAGRCLWMLQELGLEYENVPVSFLGDSRKPEYLAINPNGHIPCLDDNGLILFESMAINLHLARTYGAGGIWPADEADQSRVIQWSIWGMTEVEPPLMTVLMNRAFLPEPQRDETKAEAGEAGLKAPLQVLEDVLKDRDYILGSEFTAADLNVHSILSWGPALGRMDVSDTARLARWLTRCGERPSLARVYPS